MNVLHKTKFLHIFHKPPHFFLNPCNFLHILKTMKPTMALKLEEQVANLCDQGDLESALKALERGINMKINATQHTYSKLLDRCAREKSLTHGKRIHGILKNNGKTLIPLTGNSLIYMYSKCSCIEDARQVFDKIPIRDRTSWNHMLGCYVNTGNIKEAQHLFDKMGEKNCVSWNIMLSGFVKNNLHFKALEMFQGMHCCRVAFNHSTFTSILRGCATIGACSQAQEVHALIVKSGFSVHLFVASAMVDAYAKLGLLSHARQVFEGMPHRDVLSWTAMVSGYARNGMLELACQVFDKMPERNFVSWTAMVSAYSDHGFGDVALRTLGEMLTAGFRPNEFAFGSLLMAFASIACAKRGKLVHCLALKLGLEGFVADGVVDMYGKCGIIKDGELAFSEILKPGIVAWNAMIGCYAYNGCGREGIQMFEEMIKKGIAPDHVSFVVVLCACSHAGLVKEGKEYFSAMSREFSIVPREAHYTCLVDLLGRAGLLDEAIECIENMPLKPNVDVWRSLLGASKIHGNVVLAERAANAIFELNSHLHCHETKT